MRCGRLPDMATPRVPDEDDYARMSPTRPAVGPRTKPRPVPSPPEAQVEEVLAFYRQQRCTPTGFPPALRSTPTQPVPYRRTWRTRSTPCGTSFCTWSRKSPATPATSTSLESHPTARPHWAPADPSRVGGAHRCAGAPSEPA